MNVRGLIILFLALLSLPVSASEFVADQQVTLSGTYPENVYASGQTVILDSPVGGDLIVAGATILLNDSISEDLAAAASDIIVRNRIGGDARIAAGNARIMTTIQGDLVIFAGDIVLDKNSVVTGDVVVYGGEVVISGVINGSLAVKGGKVTIDGQVKGPAKLEAEDLSLNAGFSGPVNITAQDLKTFDSTAFYGPVRYWTAEGEKDLSPYIKEGGSATYDLKLAKQREDWMKENATSFFVFLGVAMAFSALILIFFYTFFFNNYFAQSGSFFGRDFLKSLGIGFLFIVIVPVLVTILFITVIGIPLGFLILTVFLLIVFQAHVLTSIIITHALDQKYGKDWSKSLIVLIAFLIYLALKGILIIPVIGFIATAVIVLAAFGAIVQRARQKNA